MFNYFSSDQQQCYISIIEIKNLVSLNRQYSTPKNNILFVFLVAHFFFNCVFPIFLNNHAAGHPLSITFQLVVSVFIRIQATNNVSNPIYFDNFKLMYYMSFYC